MLVAVCVDVTVLGGVSLGEAEFEGVFDTLPVFEAVILAVDV